MEFAREELPVAIWSVLGVFGGAGVVPLEVFGVVDVVFCFLEPFSSDFLDLFFFTGVFPWPFSSVVFICNEGRASWLWPVDFGETDDMVEILKCGENLYLEKTKTLENVENYM